jgi:hypothetical protein
MKKFTLALCATTTLLLSACQTNTIYNHRKDFSPKGHGGAWQTEYERLDRGDTRAEREAAQGDNSRRPLWRKGPWTETHWQ